MRHVLLAVVVTAILALPFALRSQAPAPGFCVAAAYSVKDASSFWKPLPAGSVVFKNGIKMHAANALDPIGDYTVPVPGVFALNPTFLAVGDYVEVLTACQ